MSGLLNSTNTGNDLLTVASDLDRIPTEGSLGKSTDSEESLAQCREWLETCQHSHPNCRKSRSPFTPTRLLDIGSGTTDSNNLIRVVDTKAKRLTGVKYATLSHCWGRRPFINLTPENEPLLTEYGIPWHELPKNFQQAITVARRALDVRYIWIDSLCIIQGPHGDFHSEASLMHAVYRNSHCNLAAADSSDSSGGLFRLRDPRSILPATYTHHSPATSTLSPPDDAPRTTTAATTTRTTTIFRRNATYRLLPATLWHDALLCTPLYARGWVFQERLLSPRLLHFAARQIFWDCGSASACEALPTGLPGPLDDSVAATDRHWRARLQDPLLRPLAGPADGSVEAFWASAVRAYTRCALTNGGDKLVAVWGIAKLVRDALGEAYGAGLWAERLEEQLAWRVEEEEGGGTRAGWRPRPLRTPSWSWASLDGVVGVGDRFAGGRRRCYVVTDHEGGPVTFEVVEKVKRPELGVRKGSSWSEQFKAWDEQQAQVGKRRSSWKIKRQESGDSTTTVVSNASQVTDTGDQPPELKSWSIAIQGWVGRLKIVSRTSAGVWTVDDLDADPENLAVEAFPDERLPNSVHKCYFVVLALSRDGFGTSDTDEEEDNAEGQYDEELNEYEEEQDEMDATGSEYRNSRRGSGVLEREEDSDSRGDEELIKDRTDQLEATTRTQDQPPVTFSGVGILMQSTGERSHFYRTGSLVITGVPLSMLRRIEKGYCCEASEELDEPHQDRGHKFRLD